MQPATHKVHLVLKRNETVNNSYLNRCNLFLNLRHSKIKIYLTLFVNIDRYQCQFQSFNHFCSMDFTFKAIKQTRQNIINLLNQFAPEELNEIPKGFKNNLIWNTGHCAITFYRLCYNPCGLELPLGSDKFDEYIKGTEPETEADIEKIGSIITLLNEGLTRVMNDYYEDVFANYKPYTTSYGVKLNNINEAIAFNLAHEALHLGYMMAIKKLLKAK